MAAEHTIKMLNVGADGNFVFEPGYLHVLPGDTVVFESTDSGHDSKSFFVPPDASHWTGKISKNVTVTFEQEGVYLYECEPHNQFGMLGVIQVGSAVNQSDAQQAVAKKEAKQMMNKGRLTKSFSQVE